MKISKNKKDKQHTHRFANWGTPLKPLDETMFPQTIETEKYKYNRLWVRPRAICYEKWNEHFLLSFIIFVDNYKEVKEYEITGTTYTRWQTMESKMESFEDDRTLKIIAQ